MKKQQSLETLLKTKQISQRTYDRAKVAKEYIENKYNLKSVLTTKWSNIIQKIQNLNINEAQKLGFKRIIIPEANEIQEKFEGIEIIKVRRILEAITRGVRPVQD